MVQITAEAEPASASRHSKAMHKAFCFITTLLTSICRNRERESAGDGTPKARNPCHLYENGAESTFRPSAGRLRQVGRRREMARGAGAVELDGVETDAEPSLGLHLHRHPGLRGGRILGRIG